MILLSHNHLIAFFFASFPVLISFSVFMLIILTTPQFKDPLLKTILTYFKVNVYADTMKDFFSSTVSLHLIEIIILLVNRH